MQWHLLANRPDLPMHAPQHESIDVSVFETRGYRFRSWEQWSLPKTARSLDADMLHALQPVPEAL